MGWTVWGSNPGEGRDFPHLSRPALGLTQPPVQWVPGLSRGKEQPGRDADPSPPMGRTACTEPQHLYKGALNLYLVIVDLQCNLKACGLAYGTNKVYYLKQSCICICRMNWVTFWVAF